MIIRRETLANLFKISETVPEVICNRFGRRKRKDGYTEFFFNKDGSMYLKILGFMVWLPRSEWDVDELK